ncbi:MAG: DUF3024 domain-containing protein [Candidatus Cloacimonetes bacterium]|nr:DUF3024 domain-containing protein [Candidatus Cloacimonadota bacterium]MBS3767989.1 DUF3024 domain-containing protein [Candidatus Cloacimonadota bacterium]
MALTEFDEKKVKILMEELLSRRRPPKHLRNKVDLAYRVKGQSVELFEIRDKWDHPGEKKESKIAKATFVKTKREWKVFWQKADSKWHRYKPSPTVSDIAEFIEIVEKDEHCCFWG